MANSQRFGSLWRDFWLWEGATESSVVPDWAGVGCWPQLSAVRSQGRLR